MASFDFNPFVGTPGASVLSLGYAEYGGLSGIDNAFLFHTSGTGVVPGSVGNPARGVRFTGASVAPAQSSKITVGSSTTIGGETSFPSVAVRCSGVAGTKTCYRLNQYPNNFNLEVVINGVATAIGSPVAGPSDLVIGDQMEITVGTDVGNVAEIRGYYNGTLLFTRTHNHGGNALAAGTPGFEVYAQSSSFIILGHEGGDGITGTPNPTITGNPAAQTATIPAAAAFAGTFTGTATSVQWKRKIGGTGAAVDVVGGTGATALGSGTVGYTTDATAASGGNHNNGDTYGFVLQPGGVESTYAALTANAAFATNIPLLIPGLASLTGFVGGLFEDETLAVLIKTFTGLNFNGSGNASINITGEGVPVGQGSYVVGSQSDGNPNQTGSPRAFQGPVEAV